MVADPADCGADVLQRRRKARLAAEPVVDRGHRETLPGQVVVEARSQRRQRMLLQLNEVYAKGVDPAEKRLLKAIKAKVRPTVKDRW